MRYLIGVDEVGRGALAGPVVVGVVAVPAGHRFLRRADLRDSKRLSGSRRESWAREARGDKKIMIRTARVTAKVIDRINIKRAAELAARRGLKRILAKIGRDNNFRIILDGGIYPSLKKVKTKTVNKADVNFKEVALASVIAKVERDKYMRKRGKIRPEYGFINHVGYGTKEHRRALRKTGISEIHRRSFLSGVL